MKKVFLLACLATFSFAGINAQTPTTKDNTQTPKTEQKSDTTKKAKKGKHDKTSTKKGDTTTTKAPKTK